jgi:hypothetical protein
MSFYNFELFLALLSTSLGLRFLCHLLALRVLHLLDDLLELFFGLWSSSCASCVLDSKFKLCAFVLSMYSSRGRLRNQVVGTLVVLPLSILCGESCLLVLWCASDRCGMVGIDEDRGKSRRPSAEDQGWSSTGRVLDG